VRVETVEIYSDAVNAAVMRHPGRKFPGVLVQGDTLYTLYHSAHEAQKGLEKDTDAYGALLELKERLAGYVSHYKQILNEHGIPLPFFESGDEESTGN
jgi:hypothetical protein